MIGDFWDTPLGDSLENLGGLLLTFGTQSIFGPRYNTTPTGGITPARAPARSSGMTGWVLPVAIGVVVLLVMMKRK